MQRQSRLGMAHGVARLSAKDGQMFLFRLASRPQKDLTLRFECDNAVQGCGVGVRHLLHIGDRQHQGRRL